MNYNIRSRILKIYKRNVVENIGDRLICRETKIKYNKIEN